MHLHVISLDVPYPPNYGGVIDIYYKLKALHAQGIKIHLHTFQYGRNESPVLRKICEQVYYYDRMDPIASMPYKVPHIVKSRRSEVLLKRLEMGPYPILFEGLHTCFYINHPILADRPKFVRMHNVEWQYYRLLADQEPKSRWLRSQYLKIESRRLRKFEKILELAHTIFTISPRDTDYYQKLFPHVTYLPAFHGNKTINSLPGKGEYCLYHGKLNVAENHRAVMHLITEIFNGLKARLVIAGSDPFPELVDFASQLENVDLQINPDAEEMQELMEKAHMHILPTFQPTGIKLKLLNALYNGRFVLVNDQMIDHTGLEELCLVAHEPADFRRFIMELQIQDFPQSLIDQRKTILEEKFSDQKSVEILMNVLKQFDKS